MHQELINYKDAAKQTYFNQVLISNTIKVDSLYSEAKDTLTITNYSKSNKTLRKQEIIYNRRGCKRWMIDSYFDTAGRRVYEEQWNMDCNLDNNITGSLQNRKRYHYNDSGREIGMTQEFWDGGGHRVRKYNYSIDIDGKKSLVKFFKLSEYAFWD